MHSRPNEGVAALRRDGIGALGRLRLDGERTEGWGPGHGMPGVQPQPMWNRARRSSLKYRGLLALDGGRLEPGVLEAARARCVQWVDRLVILGVDTARARTVPLHALLIAREQGGVDYRLTSATGNLGDQVLHYLKRYLGITTVIVASLPSVEADWRAQAADLRTQGYRFVSLTC